MTELFKHQIEGIDFLKKTKKAIMAHEMGLGKSRMAIVAAGDSSEKGILVICPVSLKINWQREIEMVYPEDEIQVIQTGPEETIQEPVWVIINYDMLEKYSEQLKGLFEIGELETLIIDESHYIKGKSIRAAQTIALAEKARRVYCLTGTPVMNRPIELFNQLKAIGHPLSKSRSAYGKRYCGAFLKTIPRRDGRILRFWDESGATRLPELKTAIDSVLIRRTKKEVLDLPPKIISAQICELNDKWQMEYDTAWDAYLEWLESHPEGKNIENIMSAQQLVELMKLKQVCSQAKVKRIVSDIENMVDQEEKVIVFSQFTETIMRITEELGDKNIGYTRLIGADDMKDRQKAVDAFQNEDIVKIFVANIKAAGVGLNLTAASVVIFADMDWSPEIHAQAEDRAHRIGQEGTVNVYYYIVKGTIEEDIKAILEGKQEIISRLRGEKLSTD